MEIVGAQCNINRKWLRFHSFNSSEKQPRLADRRFVSEKQTASLVTLMLLQFSSRFFQCPTRDRLLFIFNYHRQYRRDEFSILSPCSISKVENSRAHGNWDRNNWIINERACFHSDDAALKMLIWGRSLSGGFVHRWINFHLSLLVLALFQPYPVSLS